MVTVACVPRDLRPVNSGSHSTARPGVHSKRVAVIIFMHFVLIIAINARVPSQASKPIFFVEFSQHVNIKKKASEMFLAMMQIPGITPYLKKNVYTCSVTRSNSVTV